MQATQVRTHSPRQTGLSLIELMIALVVGLILITGVISIYLSSRKSYGINSAVGQIQENARAALNFIRVNTRMAGYLGCGSSGAQFANQLNPPGSGGTLPYDFGNAISGYEYQGTGPTDSYTLPATVPSSSSRTSWAPTLSTSIPTTAANHALPGSDIFAVSISQGTSTPSYVTSLGSSPDSFTVAANNNSLAAGDLLIISNCVQTVVREATSVSGLNISTSTGSGSPGNSGVLPAMLASNAQVTTASVAAYYVGMGTDSSPALYEAVTDTAQTSGFRPEEIASGVENMQVLYGMDSNGTQTPGQYLTADAVNALSSASGMNQWNNVVSVRVALLMRSPIGAVPQPATAQHYELLGTTVYAPKDTRLRQVFTTTIGLRNRLLRP